MHAMKDRVTLMLSPDVVKKAKRIVHVRRTSVSALIEELVRRSPVSSRERAVAFVDTWAGRFRARRPAKPDARLAYLKSHYGLEE